MTQSAAVPWQTITADQACEAQKSACLTEEFGYALTDLEQTVDTLWGRLHSVLTPSYSTTAAAAAAEPAPQASPLRDQLHRAHAVTASLYRLIDQLEV